MVGSTCARSATGRVGGEARRCLTGRKLESKRREELFVAEVRKGCSLRIG